MLTSVQNYNEALEKLRADSSVKVVAQENLLNTKNFNATFASFEESLNSLYEKTRVAFELKEHIDQYVDSKILYAQERIDKANKKAAAAMMQKSNGGFRYYTDTFTQLDTNRVHYDRDGRALDACKIYDGNIVPYTSINSGGQHATIYNKAGDITINLVDYKKEQGVQLLIEDEARLGGAVKGEFIFVPDIPVIANRISFTTMNGSVIGVSVYDKYNIETPVTNLETCTFREQEVHKVKFSVLTSQEVI